MKPIAIQLFTVREYAKKDFKGTLKRIAEIGYVGVEPAGLHGLSPKDFKSMVDEYGLKVPSSHVPFPTEANIKEIVETAHILGQQYVGSGFEKELFEDIDSIKSLAGKVNKAIELLKKENLKLALHNHHWEFIKLGGRFAYDYLLDLTPDVELELDTYGASNFQANNPAEIINKHKKRIPLLHLKDGPPIFKVPMVAVGKGDMDFKKVIAATDPNVLQWLIVELGSCATDMFVAVEDSYEYLTKHGLAKGNH